FSVYKIIFENNRARHWAYFSLFSFMGFYVMPSFLYPFFTLNLVLLLLNFRGLFRQVLFGIATVVAVVIVYMPVVTVNGMDVLTGRKQMQSTARSEVLSSFPQFASDSLAEVTGISFPVLAFLLLAALLILILQKNNRAIKLLAAFVTAPLLLM